MYGFDPEEYAREPEKEHCITVAEVFARLEKEEYFLISNENALFKSGNMTAILCGAVGIMYGIQYGDLFRNLADHLRESKYVEFYWEKRDSDFSLMLTFAESSIGSVKEPTFIKTVRAGSLMKCFEELDMFFFQ